MASVKKIPNHWKKERLEKVAHVQTGIAKGGKSSKNMVMMPYLRVANVQDGYLDLSVIKEIQVDRDKIQRYLLQDGDVLMTEGGDFDKLGRGTVWREQIKQCLHQNHVFAVRVNRDYLIPDFLSFLTGSHYGKDYFVRCSKQSTNLASINSTQLKNFPVLLPPLEEQRKILAIVHTWDEAIEKTERLIDRRSKKFKVLQRQYAVDLPKAPQKEIGKAFARVQRVNDGKTDAPVMTISSLRGFMRQDEKYNREMAGDSLERYILLEKDEFAYNKGNSKTYPQGCIFQLEEEKALIPHVYFCFKAKNDLEPRFYRHFFLSGGLNRQLYRVINSGVRNDGLLNLNAENFFTCTVPVPPRRYQEQAADFLDAAEKEISVLRQKLDILKNQKRGLMQKLLTGEWRVKVDGKAMEAA